MVAIHYIFLQLRPEFTDIVSSMERLPQMIVGKGMYIYVGCHSHSQAIFQEEKWPGKLSKFKMYTDVMSWQLFFFIQALNIRLVYVIVLAAENAAFLLVLLQFLQQIEV